MSAHSQPDARRTGGLIAVLPYLADIIVPLASYYVLTAAGLSAFWALVIGGALTSIVALVNTIRRSRLDSLGVLVIAEVVLGIVLDLGVQSARLTLARQSLFIAVAGAWILASAFTARPLTVNATKPFAVRRGGQEGLDAVEWLVANSRRYLRIHRMLSALWGVMFLAYAAARVIIIYSITLSQAVWFTEVPGIIAIVICLFASARAGKRFEVLVAGRMAQVSGKPASDG